jgi:symplekin
MTAIKQRILQIWQNAITPVRICCIKFAQRVVLSQTNTDARHRGPLDVSLDKVPSDHDTLDARMLEGEAMGLLDRMLSVLQDNSR